MVRPKTGRRNKVVKLVFDNQEYATVKQSASVERIPLALWIRKEILTIASIGKHQVQNGS